MEEAGPNGSRSDAPEKPRKRRLFITAVDPRKFPGPYINPWLRLTIYVLCVFFTGTIYMGWNGYQSLLYKSGAFEDLCANAADISSVKLGDTLYVDCGLRKAAINNLYTIAFSTHLLSAVLAGIIFDHIGPKYSFMIAQFTHCVTWILISTMPKNPHVLRVSFFFIGLTAESLVLPLMTISYYFPLNQSLIISVIGATRSLSFMVPIILSKIFELDFFKPKQFYIIGVSYGLFANLSSFAVGGLIVQQRFFPRKKKPVGEESELSDDSSQNTKTDLGVTREKPKETKLVILKTRIKRVINHPQFIEYIVLVIVASVYLASVEFISKAQRELLLCTDGSSAVDWFKYIHVLTFAPGPLMGFLVDKLGPAFVLVILHSCCFMYYFLVSFDYYALKILACVFYLFSCSMLVSHIYCYVSKRFQLKNFGRLVGFCFFSSGLFVTINVPLYNFMTNRLSIFDTHNLKVVTRVFMGYMVTGFALSLLLLYLTKRKIVIPVSEVKDVE